MKIYINKNQIKYEYKNKNKNKIKLQKILVFVQNLSFPQQQNWNIKINGNLCKHAI